MLNTAMIIALFFGQTGRLQSVLTNEYAFDRTVTGRISCDDGSSPAGFVVAVRFRYHQTGMPGEGHTVTDVNGRFELKNLGSQQFLLYVENGGKPYVTPSLVSLDLTKVKRIDNVDLRLRLGPKLTIRVRDAETKHPMIGVPVEISPSNFSPRQTLTTSREGMLKTRVGYLGFDVSIRDSGPKPKFGQAPGYPLWRSFKLDKVNDVEWDVLVYSEPNFQNRPATFHGTVVDESGRPVAGAKVTVHRFNDIVNTKTDDRGRFELKSNRVAFFEDEKGGVVVEAEKGTLTAMREPKASETWDTIRLTLKPNRLGSFSGRVVNEAGRPLDGCRISFYQMFRAGSVGTIQPQKPGVTGSDGRFTIGHIEPNASYDFAFGTWYRGGALGTTHIPTEWPSGKWITVSPGQNRDLGTIVVPIANRNVSGTIVDVAGKPVTKLICVTLKGTHTDVNAELDGRGGFVFKGVPNEPTILRVFVGDGSFFRTADDSPDLLFARSVTVQESDVRVVVKMRAAKK